MLDILKNIFRGNPLADYEATVVRINALETEMKKFSDEDLRRESARLRSEALASGSVEEILPRAFAIVREASRRTLRQRPYDVQLIGGLALHNRAIAEMMTGEGKTLSAVAPAYLNALLGKGVHVVTVNEYLARRDAVNMGQIYRLLGLSVACLVPNSAFLYDPEWHVKEDEGGPVDTLRDTAGNFLVQQEYLRPITRREAYLADITYGTNHEFGFDYLRDNLAYNPASQVQRGHFYAIIDEADSILIDEARTPLIIAAPDEQSSDFYKTFAHVAAHLDKDAHFLVDEKKRTVSITGEGIEKVEKMIGVANLYAPEHLRLVHYLEESLRAKALFRRDKDYVVKGGEVLIVDEFTGRILQGRRYSGGLHQAIEAKESVLVKEESRTYAKISIQNYFRQYAKISGMTGTAQTSAEEFFKVYGLEVVSIPPNRPMIRTDHADKIYKSASAKWAAVVEDIKERHHKGQPVLVGTTSIEKNEIVDALLSKANIPHEVLNAKNNEREGAIIAQAGRKGAVTVATNMAGRGVDIILGGNPPDEKEAEVVRVAGGLHVVGTERHEARRIDNQLRGRAGRQGDPGSSQFFLSVDDDLLRIFGGDRIKTIMEKFDLPDNEPIQVGFVSKAVAQAQGRVEGSHFDLRKHLLEYDDVLNKQRSAVYKRRQDIMDAAQKGELAPLIFEAAAGHLGRMMEALRADHAATSPLEDIKKAVAESGITTLKWQWPEESDPHRIEEELREVLAKRSVEVSVAPVAAGRLLNIVDLLWMNHLEDLEALSESVGLRAYAQRDPLVEYRQEARSLFGNFWSNFDGWVFSNVFKIQENTVAPVPAVQISADSAGSETGRNEPCPCGSGKKYKKCGLLHTEEHEKRMSEPR